MQRLLDKTTNRCVVGAVLDHAEHAPDRPAVKDFDRALTRSELCAEAARVAAGLHQNGVQPGARVALLIGNSVDFVVAALGCLWAGVTFVPLAITDPDVRRTQILADCRPALVITAGSDHTAPSGLPVGTPWSPAFRAERDSRADTAAGGRPHFVHHLHVGDDRCPQGRADPRRGLPHRGRSVRGRRGTHCGRPRTVRVARALRRIFLRDLPPARARRAPRHPRPGGPAVPAQVLLGRRRRGDHGDQLLAELPSVASVQRAPGPVGRYAAASDGPRRRSAVHRRHQSGVDRQPGTTGGEPVRADRGDDRRRSSEPDAGAARGRPGADRPAASRQLVPPGRRARDAWWTNPGWSASCTSAEGS